MKVDLVVVSVSLMLELALHHGLHGDGEHGEEAEYSELAGLLILARIPWRLVRVAHAIVVTLEKVQQSEKHGEAIGEKHDETELRRLRDENSRLKAQVLALGTGPDIAAPPNSQEEEKRRIEGEATNVNTFDRARRGSTQ